MLMNLILKSVETQPPMQLKVSARVSWKSPTVHPSPLVGVLKLQKKKKILKSSQVADVDSKRNRRI